MEPEGKKDARISFACPPEFEVRLRKLAQLISRSRPGNEITYTQLAYKFVREGMEKELGRFMLLKNGIESLFKDNNF